MTYGPNINTIYIREIPDNYQIFLLIGQKGLLLSINFMNGRQPECCGFINYTQLSGTQAHQQINYSTDWMSIIIGEYCKVFIYSNLDFSLSLN